MIHRELTEKEKRMKDILTISESYVEEIPKIAFESIVSSARKIIETVETNVEKVGSIFLKHIGRRDELKTLKPSVERAVKRMISIVVSYKMQENPESEVKEKVLTSLKEIFDKLVEIFRLKDSRFADLAEELVENAFQSKNMLETISNIEKFTSALLLSISNIPIK